MTAAAHPHDHDITVGPDAIDFMGHVNNAHYLSWVQDAVLAHWRKLARPEAVAPHLWVELKPAITYRPPAFLDHRGSATGLREKVQGGRALSHNTIRHGAASPAAHTSSKTAK